jgi:hypothetical protein
MYRSVLGYDVQADYKGTDNEGEMITVTLQLHKEQWVIRGVPDQIEELLSSAAGHIRERFLKARKSNG